MTKKQRAYQISLLRQLHLSKRYLELYKDDQILYRHFLETNLSVTSSKMLSIDVLKELVDYFNFERDTIPNNGASQQQINFIKHLWSRHSTNKDESSLLRFITRTTKKTLATINQLSPNDAKIVIAGIKKLKPTNYANNPNYSGA